MLQLLYIAVLGYLGQSTVKGHLTESTTLIKEFYIDQIEITYFHLIRLMEMV